MYALLVIHTHACTCYGERSVALVAWHFEELRLSVQYVPKYARGPPSCGARDYLVLLCISVTQRDVHDVGLIFSKRALDHFVAPAIHVLS